MRKGPQGDRHIFRPQRVEVAQQPNGPKNEPVPGGLWGTVPILAAETTSRKKELRRRENGTVPFGPTGDEPCVKNSVSE